MEENHNDVGRGGNNVSSAAGVGASPHEGAIGRSEAGNLLAESLLGDGPDPFQSSDHGLGVSGVTPSMFRGTSVGGGSVGAGLHRMGIDMDVLGVMGGGEGSGQNMMNRNFSLGELTALDFDTPIEFNGGGR